MPKAEIAAPAVHVDQWKHWSMSEGLKRCRRTAPEGCAVVVDGDNLSLQEMRSGREFALHPRPPDAQAWFDANRDDLRGGKNWQRRRMQALARAGRQQPAAHAPGHMLTAGIFIQTSTNFRPRIASPTWRRFSASHKSQQQTLLN